MLSNIARSDEASAHGGMQGEDGEGVWWHTEGAEGKEED